MRNTLRFLVLTLALVLTTLGANAAVRGDVNSDGEINIADINSVIDMILSSNDDIKTFLMYDLDIQGIYEKLNSLDATLLLSNPCIELWYLLHSKEQRAELTAPECIKRLQSSDQVWNDYRKPLLSSKQRELLWNNKEIAVKRAKSLNDFENPSSTIYKFIEILDSEINPPSGAEK